VNKVVFVEVQQARGDLARHPLEDEGIWGFRICSLTAPQVALQIPLRLRKRREKQENTKINAFPIVAYVIHSRNKSDRKNKWP
jgi:hypothetical protein